MDGAKRGASEHAFKMGNKQLMGRLGFNLTGKLGRNHSSETVLSLNRWSSRLTWSTSKVLIVGAIMIMLFTLKKR